MVCVDCRSPFIEEVSRKNLMVEFAGLPDAEQKTEEELRKNEIIMPADFWQDRRNPERFDVNASAAQALKVSQPRRPPVYRSSSL